MLYRADLEQSTVAVGRRFDVLAAIIVVTKLEADRLFATVDHQSRSSIRESHHHLPARAARVYGRRPEGDNVLTMNEPASGKSEPSAHLLFVGRVDVITITDVHRYSQCCMRIGLHHTPLHIA